MRNPLVSSRRIVPAILLAAMLPGAPAARQEPGAGWTVEDADGQWTLTAPAGWYGGSYYKIRDVLASAETDKDGPPVLVPLLRALIQEARGVGAILLKLELSRDGSHGDGSFVKIRSTPAIAGAEFPPITSLTDDTWANYAQRLLSSRSGAQDVRLIRHDENLAIGGNPVATAHFLVVKGGDKDRFESLLIIYRKPAVTSLKLDAPWHLAESRLEEMWTMARSIRFLK